MRLTKARRKQVAAAVSVIRENMAVYGTAFTSPDMVKDFLTLRLGPEEKEQFLVMFLSNNHHLIADEILFVGTIDAAAVYPREVIKRVLELNATAIVIAHNHPSGDPTPSTADINLTNDLNDVLRKINVRLLDHIIVGSYCSSFLELDLL